MAVARVHQRIIICGSILVALVIALHLLRIAGGNDSSLLWSRVLGLAVAEWWSVGILLAALLIVIHLCLVASRLRRDAEHLRDQIQDLRRFDPDIGSRKDGFRFTYHELDECASELTRVAGWLQTEQSRLADRASRDVLTGLPNRRFLIDILEREVAAARRAGWPLSFVMADLDHFKELNDTFGHQAGDLVLKRAAQRLASLVRRSDVVARWGGEEFAIVLPRARMAEAVQLTQQLRDALRCSSVEFEDWNLRVTASFGVAEMQVCGLSGTEELVKAADAALYEAKKGGRDRVVSADTVVQSDSAPNGTGNGGDRRAGDASRQVPEHLTADSNVIDGDTMALMGSTFSLLNATPDMHRVAYDTIQQLATVLQCHHIVLYLDRGKRDGFVAIAALGDKPHRGPDERRLAELTKWYDGLSDCQMRSFDQLVQLTAGPRRAKDSGSKGIARLPLWTEEGLLGAVEADDVPNVRSLTKRQRGLMAAVCLMGARALRICQVFRAAEADWASVVETICKVQHREDTFKSDHAARVSALACNLAMQLGLHDPESLRMLRLAGLLGDVGAACVPHGVWSKRRRLSSREWRLIQSHPRVSAELVQESTNLARLAEIVLHHHEHYDGSGYPESLVGEQIPFESRVLAVADAYVAMTSPRPYRQPLTHQDAIAELAAGIGTQFDPAVVEAFLSAHDAAAPASPFEESLETDDVPAWAGAAPAV